ncbi:MAG: class I SAM-dependent methyltransferase [Anaerolineae bacterium]|jgi:SAM-dependent methyltransferase
MHEMVDLADKEFVADQYRTAGNLNARITLHQRFSTNRYGWQRWIFDQFHFPDRARILELACGTGDLWLENKHRISAGWRVTLSDLSPGMVEQARQRLEPLGHPFQFDVIDAQSIPFDSHSLDGVIANHMLYHVPDRERALSEIARVLKPGGRFYTSTIGGAHLQEIRDLLTRFHADLSMWGERPTDSFTLENGAAQLEHHFGEVALDRYDDILLVTEPEALVDYIFSGRLEMGEDQRQAFAAFVHEEFRRLGGFYITKDSGLFTCY